MRTCLFIGMICITLIACKKENKPLNGYIDAQLIYLSADYGGRLLKLNVNKGQEVTANEVLFKLDQTSEQYDAEVSKLNKRNLLAQRNQILSELHFNEIHYNRTLSMQKERSASQSDLDIAQRDLSISKERLEAINAQVQSSNLDLADKQWKISRKENTAPDSGIVFDTYYQIGEFVPMNHPILSLITKNNIKAIFFVSDAVLNTLQLNESVKIKSENGVFLAQGRIAYISPVAEFTPPVIYSTDESARLVFKVEAQVDTPALDKLHLGQPILLELIKHG